MEKEQIQPRETTDSVVNADTLRENIISDNVSMSDLPKSDSPDNTENTGDTSFSPFNYEHAESTPSTSKSGLKEGDVIKISKAKLAELNIDPEKIAKAFNSESVSDDYTQTKIVEDDKRVVLPRETSPALTYTETKFASSKSSFLVDIDKVKISEAEKEEFFRKTLAGEPYEYVVYLKKGAAEMRFITKNVGLQQISLNMMPWLLQQKKEDGTPAYDYNSMFLWITKAEVITTLTTFNGRKLFKFNDIYDPKVKLSEQQFFDMLKDDMDTIDRIPQPVWVLLVNGCRVHEQKDKLLNEYIINEDF